MAVGDLSPLLERALAALPADAGVAVAYSGGPDSTALLHLLAGLPAARARGLRALHVDHGLHPDAGDWARLCAGVCARLAVPLAVLPVNVPSGGSVEDAARRARYAALGAALGAGEHLACAHHREDQAETLLLRLMRGAGVDALAGMRTLRPLGRGWLWRPLLDTPREALHAAASASGLPVVNDPANSDPAHDRSWLRTRLLPLMATRWPQATASLAHSATRLREGAGLLAADDALCLAGLQTADERVIDLRRLAALPAERARRVLRLWVARLGLPPVPSRCLAQVLDELVPAAADRAARVAWRGARLLKWRHWLHAASGDRSLPTDLDRPWDGRRPLELPDGAGLAFEPGVPPGLPAMRVRARRGGETLRLPGRDHRTPLKGALQALAVPTWERTALPLLVAADSGEVLAAGDLVVAAPLAEALSRHDARLRWTPPA